MLVPGLLSHVPDCVLILQTESRQVITERRDCAVGSPSRACSRRCLLVWVCRGEKAEMARPVCPGPAVVHLVDPIKPTGRDETAQAEPELMRRVSSPVLWSRRSLLDTPRMSPPVRSSSGNGSMIPSVRCFMKRVDGGANVERDASIGVGQSNGRRGHEDEGESVLFLQLWEPPAIAIGVATEKAGSKSSDLEVGTLSRDRR